MARKKRKIGIVLANVGGALLVAILVNSVLLGLIIIAIILILAPEKIHKKLKRLGRFIKKEPFKFFASVFFILLAAGIIAKTTESLLLQIALLTFFIILLDLAKAFKVK